MIRRLCRLFGCVLLCGHLVTGGQAGEPAAGAKIEPDSMVFVGGRSSKSIAGIDSRTDETVMTYATPGVPVLSLAAGKQRRLVTITRQPRRISVFALEHGQPIVSQDPGFGVTMMQLAPDGRMLAVAGPSGLAFLDVATGRLRKIAPLVGVPGSMVFDRAGAVLLFGDARFEVIHMVDTRSGARLPDLSLGRNHDAVGVTRGVVHLARTPGGSTAMAVHGLRHATVIDLKTKKIIKRLTLPGQQDRIFPTANSQYFIVPNQKHRTVSLISTWTHAESERFRFDYDVRSVNTALADTVLFAFAKRLPRATIIDLNSRSRLKEISLPSRPETAVLSPGGLKLYVAMEADDTVAVIDVRALRIKKLLRKIPAQPWAVFSASGLSYCH